MTTEERLKLWKKRYVTRENFWRVLIVIVMVTLAITGLYLDWRFSDEVLKTWSFWGYSLASLGPEIAGIVIGVVFIDALNERRQNKQLKARLIREMGSPIRDVAVPAVRELAHHGWLYDGSLKGAQLEGTNLEGAKLWDANLEKAILQAANSEKADLYRANLAGATLPGINLKNADLWQTHLEGAFMFKANLEGANLTSAHLEGANLEKANMQGANADGAQLPKANLRQVRFEGANLKGANLEGAFLEKTKSLTSQQLRSAYSIKGATMPDLTKLVDLEQWLATEPKCILDFREAEEAGAIGLEELIAELDNSNLADGDE